MGNPMHGQENAKTSQFQRVQENLKGSAKRSGGTSGRGKRKDGVLWAVSRRAEREPVCGVMGLCQFYIEHRALKKENRKKGEKMTGGGSRVDGIPGEGKEVEKK